MALTQRGNKTSAVNIIKASRYENPQEALNLMAKICNTQDTRPKVSTEKLDELLDGENGINSHEDILYMGYRISGIVENFKSSLHQNEAKGYAKVVVAGGFSAGKSTMLNKLTQLGNLLPTGMEPVSVIPTYIYCHSTPQTLNIKGENLKGHLVDLDTDVLECIQHSSETKVYLASVLEKVFIEKYIPEYSGIVFIDTPGYNNSNAKNTVNNRRDKDTTETELKGADVIFWLIDIEAGTVTTTDLQMLNNYKDKKKVIIFTKADKKDTANIQRIVKEAGKTLNIDNDKNIIDIIAMSTQKDDYYSYKNNTLSKVIDLVKKSTQPHDYVREVVENFDIEIKDIGEYIIDCAEKRQGHSEELKQANQKLINCRNNANYYEGLKNNVAGIIVKSYNEVYNAAHKMQNLVVDSIKIMDKELDKQNSGFFGSMSDYLLSNYKQMCTAFNKANDWQYYKESWRKDILKQIIECIDYEKTDLEDYFQKLYDEINGNIQTLSAEIDKNEKLIETLIDFKKEITGEMNSLIAEQDRLNKQHKKEDIQKAYNIVDVFQAIATDNLNAFHNCLAVGIDISQCNTEGYNPITWAVRYGNNEIVKIFLRKGADFSTKDKKGFNALETAVIYQFKDICDLILDSPDGRSILAQSSNVEELANQNIDNFKNWITYKIK